MLNPYRTLFLALLDRLWPLMQKTDAAALSLSACHRLQSEIKTLIDEAQLKQRVKEANDDAFAQVKYALVSFCDEVLLNASAPLKPGHYEPLQLLYFNEYQAGVGFFKRLSHLLEASKEATGVLEIYYLCLVFGFKGRYLQAEDAGLVQHKQQLLSQLMPYWEGLKPKSTCIPAPAALIESRVTPWKLGLGLSACLLLGAYTFYAVSLNHALKTYAHLLVETRHA